MKALRFIARVVAGGLLVLTGFRAHADTFVWTGKSYMPIGVQLGSDVILTLPEPFDYNFEQPSANQIIPWSDNSIIIRPNVAEQEQRLFLKGKTSGKQYIAKVSSKLPFAPTKDLVDGAAMQVDGPRSDGTITMTALMKAMMQGTGMGPAGFQIERSSKILLNYPPYKIVASEVWVSPSRVGIVATISGTVPNATIPIVPSNIQIRIPEFGALRMIGADTWEVSPAMPSTRIYFVFAR